MVGRRDVDGGVDLDVDKVSRGVAKRWEHHSAPSNHDWKASAHYQEAPGEGHSCENNSARGEDSKKGEAVNHNRKKQQEEEEQHKKERPGATKEN